MPVRALETLLAGFFDYAGLFPPARLSMADTVERFAHYRQAPHAWMLERIVVPLDRLGELETAVAAAQAPNAATSNTAPGSSWSISALVAATSLDDLLADLERLHAFNDAHQRSALLHVDAVELKTPSATDVETAFAALEQGGDDLLAAFELPLDKDPRGMLAAIAAADTPVIAKMRTGGVTPDAIPPVEHVARFISACATAAIPFKATAGLHHPVRAEQPLTYERLAPRAVMHGFFNVLLATAAAHQSAGDDADVIALLEETDPATFEFDDQGATWAGLRFAADQLALVRERLFLSVGSCSFDEPVRDLQALGLLERAR